MKSIRMLTDRIGSDGEALKSGEVYSLEDASAEHHVKRGKAEYVDETTEVKPSDTGMKKAELVEALTKAGIEVPAGASKADLQKLYDDSTGHAGA